MTNSADQDQLASSEANWSGSTLFVKAGHIRAQQDQGYYYITCKALAKLQQIIFLFFFIYIFFFISDKVWLSISCESSSCYSFCLGCNSLMIWNISLKLHIMCHDQDTWVICPCHMHQGTLDAGLGGSVGCAIQLETRRSRVQPPPRSATFFHGDWSWNIFYGHSLPSADSRRAVVSFWRKNVHNTG